MQRLSERASRDAGGEQLGLDGVAERAPADELLALSNWAGRTETGDRAELDVEPSAVAWSAVSERPGVPRSGTLPERQRLLRRGRPPQGPGGRRHRREPPPLRPRPRDRKSTRLN